jgi:hypothetical protein
MSCAKWVERYAPPKEQATISRVIAPKKFFIEHEFYSFGQTALAPILDS